MTHVTPFSSTQAEIQLSKIAEHADSTLNYTVSFYKSSEKLNFEQAKILCWKNNMDIAIPDNFAEVKSLYLNKDEDPMFYIQMLYNQHRENSYWLGLKYFREKLRPNKDRFYSNLNQFYYNINSTSRK